MSARGFNDTTDHLLIGFSRRSQLQLLLLFVITIESEPGKRSDAHINALRRHWLEHLQPQDLFTDWVTRQGRKQTLSAKEASLRKELHLRLPTPIAFIVWMRETYFVKGVDTNNAWMCMVYLANALAMGYEHLSIAPAGTQTTRSKRMMCGLKAV